MKTLKYFPIIMLLTVASYSQNIIDPQVLTTNFNNPYIFDRNFNDTTFIRGLNWGSPGRAWDEAMHINFYHDGYDPVENDQNEYTVNTLYIPNHRKATEVTGVSGGRQGDFILNAHSLMLYPAITVDSTQSFVPRAFDSTWSVFGFINKSKVILLDSSLNDSSNYCRAILNKDSLITGQSHV